MSSGLHSPTERPDRPPLHLDLPKRLFVPRPRVQAPRQRAQEALAPTKAPRWHDVSWPAATAQLLVEQLAPRASDVYGTLDLTGVPWNDVPPPPDEVAREQDPALAGEAGERPQVPLWQRLTYLLQPPVSVLLATNGPVEWPHALFPYQLHGVLALLARETLLLADDMGLGKTVQAAAALRVLALRGQVGACLLIAPANLLGQWRRMLRLWAPELRLSTVRGPAAERAWQWKAPAHVYLTAYETFREDCGDSPHSPPRRRLWDLVVLDEAQRIKNREAEISRKTKLLRRRRAWALTGTPVENSLDDVASVLDFLAPRRVAAPRGTSRQTLVEQLREVQLRRRKADVLPQLPDKLLTQIVLPLTSSQRESYDRVEREGVLWLREQGAQVQIDNVLDLIIRLKQICNFCPATGQSAKLEDLRQRLATLAEEDHRALVFTQFVEGRYGAHALAARLRAFSPLLYTGRMSVAERDATLDRFKTDPSHRVLVLSLRAGGLGLNLQEASYVFHFDRWWNPAVERQAEDRAHRLGQQRPVHVYSYVTEATIEERIDRVLRQKQALFDEIVDDLAVEPWSSLQSTLSAEEMLGLFGLSVGTSGQEA